MPPFPKFNLQQDYPNYPTDKLNIAQRSAIMSRSKTGSKDSASGMAMPLSQTPSFLP